VIERERERERERGREEGREGGREGERERAMRQHSCTALNLRVIQ
jgi:hypothetical protein